MHEAIVMPGEDCKGTMQVSDISLHVNGTLNGNYWGSVHSNSNSNENYFKNEN